MRALLAIVLALVVGAVAIPAAAKATPCGDLKKGAWRAVDIEATHLRCRSARAKLRRWLPPPLPRNQVGWYCDRVGRRHLCSAGSGDPPRFTFVLRRRRAQTTLATATAVFLPNCGNSHYGGRVAPRNWDAGCTGDRELLRTTWSRWGRRVAIGKGQTAVNDCDPSCAEGTVTRYPARARAFRIRTCRGRSGKRRRFYTRLRLTVRMPERHTTTFRLVCAR
jgi:hypothetical protein